MFAIFRHFREFGGSVDQLVDVLRELVKAQRDAGPALDRLDALELSRHQFEAEVQGVLLEAKGKLKASRSSEERERQIAKRANDRLADPFADDGEEAAEAGPALLHAHDAGGEAERVHSLHLGLAPDHKAAAVNAKWGR